MEFTDRQISLLYDAVLSQQGLHWKFRETSRRFDELVEIAVKLLEEMDRRGI